jgi:hypothetical protein
MSYTEVNWETMAKIYSLGRGGSGLLSEVLIVFDWLLSIFLKGRGSEGNTCSSL